MSKIIIEGGNPLKGSISIKGSKNSSLPIIIASCLSGQECCIENIPNIKDVNTVINICRSFGASIELLKNNTIAIEGSMQKGETIKLDKESCKNIRGSYYFMGMLIHLYDEVWVGCPGGDNIGTRPIDQHIKGFGLLGVEVNLIDGYYRLKKKSLMGAKITFDVVTSGGTINMILASVLAHGTTVLSNAAIDPEVVDVAVFLNEMGASIKGAGTKRITIKGVEYLRGAKHRVIPDRIVAGSLFIAAGVTGGDILVEDLIPYHLMTVTNKLHELGLRFTIYKNAIRCSVKDGIKGGRIDCDMYPAFPTDLQPLLTTLLLKAEGESRIIDFVFPERFNHCVELEKMGADLKRSLGQVIIRGGNTLKGAKVKSTDIRGGIALLIAGLGAKGSTLIEDTQHICRGYEDVVEMFQSLGGEIFTEL